MAAVTRDCRRPQLDRPYVAPRDVVELRLTRLWEQVLGLWGVGVYDDFLALGGNPPLGARLVGAIAEEFGRQLDDSVLAEAPTIDRLAAALRAEGQMRAWTSLLTLQAGRADRAPLFWLHGSEGWPFWYQGLLGHLGPEQPAFGLVFSGLDGCSPLHARLESMAAHYATEIRSVQPHGPYQLVGPASAGVCALAVASELRAQGEEVGLLALCAPPSPGDTRPWQPPVQGSGGKQRPAWLGWGKRPAYLRRQIARYWRSYLRTSLRWLGYEGARRLGLGKQWAYGPELVKLAQGCCQLAWLRYLPRPYTGRATLFVSQSGLAREGSDLAPRWRQFVTGVVEVIAVPGDGDMMLQEPYVRRLAGHLAERLARTPRPSSTLAGSEAR